MWCNIGSRNVAYSVRYSVCAGRRRQNPYTVATGSDWTRANSGPGRSWKKRDTLSFWKCSRSIPTSNHRSIISTVLHAKVICNCLIAFLRPPVIRVSDKVMIPQEEHPEINFVGLLIGPRGNTLKSKLALFKITKGYTILTFSYGEGNGCEDYNSR